MPLLRSRMQVHRTRFRAGVGLYVVAGISIVGFAAVLIGHDLFGWW